MQMHVLSNKDLHNKHDCQQHVLICEVARQISSRITNVQSLGIWYPQPPRPLNDVELWYQK